MSAFLMRFTANYLGKNARLPQFFFVDTNSSCKDLLFTHGPTLAQKPLNSVDTFLKFFFFSKLSTQASFKAGVNIKAVFWLCITQISRSRFKQSRISLLIPHIYVLGRFVNFLVIFLYIWR